MSWWDELSENTTDALQDAGEWVADKASDGWDATVDAGATAWDNISDWVTGEDAPVDQVELDGAPTKDQMWEALDTIRPILLEGYRRQEAYDRFGHEVALQHVGSLELIPSGGGYVDSEGQRDWRTIAGYYRQSETLGFLMPAAIPDDVADNYSNGKQMQTYWTGTTESDDLDVNATAQGRTIVQLADVEEAYRDLLAQCDLSAMGELLPKLNAVCTKSKEIYDTHYDREAQEILEVWNEWEASEIEKVTVKEFGNQVRQALLIHWDGASEIVYSASTEATIQTHVMVQAYNNIADTWDLILEKLNSSSAQDQAISKFIGTITVNRIPFASDLVAAHDFIVEAATNGKVQSPAANFFNGIIDRLSGKDVPDGDTCAEVVKMLTEGAEDCFEGLTEARDKYSREGLATSAVQWDGYWTNGLVYEVIPGNLDG